MKPESISNWQTGHPKGGVVLNGFSESREYDLFLHNTLLACMLCSIAALGCGGGGGDMSDTDKDGSSVGHSGYDGNAEDKNGEAGNTKNGDAEDGNTEGGDAEEQMNAFVGEPFTGEGTYYDFADGSGACMFDPSPNDMDIAALNSKQWEGSAWCGACADVNGPNGSVRVRIVDLCPECPHGNLDFSPQAFDKIADRRAGRVPIDWRFAPCDIDGVVSYKYKDGANQWWTAVQVRNHRLPVVKLEWSSDGNEWKGMERQEYNYFVDESGFGSFPVRVRVTAIDGQVLEDELPAVQENLVVQGTSQFL